MSKTCLKCQYVRQPADNGPDYACPACGAVYAKLEALAQAAQQSRGLAEAHTAALANHGTLLADRTHEGVPLLNRREINEQQEGRIDRDRRMAHFIYALFAAAFVVDVTLLLAGIVEYARDPERYNVHFHWQFRTFLVTVLSTLLAGGLAYGFRPMTHRNWVATHFDWQIRSFWWFMALCLALGAYAVQAMIHSWGHASANLLAMQFFAHLKWPLLGFSLWYLYRIGKGWFLLFFNNGL